MVQRAQRPGEVERAGSNGRLRRVALDEADVRELSARRRPCSSSSGTRSTATTSRTCGASAKASAPAPLPESSTRSSPPARRSADLLLELRGARVLQRGDPLSRLREPLPRGVVHSRAPPPWSRSYRRPAPPRSRRAGGRSPGPGGKLELVAAQERLGRIVGARLLDRAARAPSAPRNASASSAHGSVARRKRWIARGVAVGRLGPQQRGGEAAQLVRDRQAGAAVAEDRDQPVVGRVPAVEPVVDPAAERREQPERVEPPEAAGREPPQLGEDPLARRPVDERRLRADQLLGLRDDPEAELVLEADRAQQPQRVVLEDAS